MGMMDVRGKEPLSGEEVEDESKKYCVDCKTTKTPLWRGGPAGPKSLCNACGIRFRKRRVSMVSMSRGHDRKKEKTQSHGPTTTVAAATNSSSAMTTNADTKSDGGDGECLGGSLKMKLVALGEEILVKKQRCQRRRKLGEVELAAVSLMALSCGSVFA